MSLKKLFVGEQGSTLTVTTGSKTKRYELLWGDLCHEKSKAGGVSHVHARGREGTMPSADLTADPKLLEIYMIDVGQGDGLLMKTPDGKWHMLDGGRPAADQMTRKTAANFVRWKFIQDLRKTKVSIENVILTHPDLDHYGGLTDLLGGTLPKPGSDDPWTFDIEVANFLHNGVGRFTGSPELGTTTAGTTDPFPIGGFGVTRTGTFITQLIDGKGHFRKPEDHVGRSFRKSFGELAAVVGTIPQNVRALSRDDAFLSGYAPGDGDAVIHVLGPVRERFGSGQSGLRWLGGLGPTSNGHSVVLRVDMGNARILLTGDLNTKSQALLLSYVPESEFAVDVAKGCHHGADDVDLRFVAAMKARATIISSGDNEDYSHPRPAILGASARYGREGVDLKDERVPPLVYSTELARSVQLDFVERTRLFDKAKNDTDPLTTRHVDVNPTKSGSDGWRNLSRTPFSVDLVYGLVNVRTDGEKILLATLEESGTDFDKRWIKAGVGPA